MLPILERICEGLRNKTVSVQHFNIVSGKEMLNLDKYGDWYAYLEFAVQSETVNFEDLPWRD